MNWTHIRLIVVLVLLEGEVLAAVLGREAAEAGGAQRLEAERVQALDGLDLEQRVAGQDEQPVVVDVVQLGAAVLPADLGPGVVEGDAGERQLDLLLLLLPAAAADDGDLRAVEVDDRRRPDLEPLALAQGLGQRQGGRGRLELLPRPGSRSRRGRPAP